MSQPVGWRYGIQIEKSADRVPPIALAVAQAIVVTGNEPIMVGGLTR